MTSDQTGDVGLNLLLCDADERKESLRNEIARDSLSTQQSADQRAKPEYLKNAGGDKNSLEDQGWAVIIPEGDEGKRLLDLVDPLIQKRKEELGSWGPLRIYEAPAKCSGEEAIAWRKRVFATGQTTDDEIPLYQLILGNLDQVALSIQQVQSSDGYVGRLAFDKEDDYRAYVEKLLRDEDADPPTQAGRSLFFTVHDGTRATRSGYDSLVTPGMQLAQRKVMERKLPARQLLDLGDKTIPTRDELLAQVSESDPTVLFTLSHGAGAPGSGWKSAERQRREQGAMSFGSDGLLYGSDIADKTFLPGGVWFMLACYGAGTPDRSAYKHWLEALSQLGQYRDSAATVLKGLVVEGGRPFVAALPQAALSNPNGPLAFVGHVDLAWTYSFREFDAESAVNRPGKFVQLVNYALAGNRCGMMMEPIARAVDATNEELTMLYDGEAQRGSIDPNKQAKRAHRWMLRNDLGAYILLGDPAARLRVAPKKAYETAAKTGGDKRTTAAGASK